jgi:hypothetical protein
MEEVYEFLKKSGTYYLATADGDQPRVRPFGTVDIFEGKLYIQTGKVKNVSKQMRANPKIEISSMLAASGSAWKRPRSGTTGRNRSSSCLSPTPSLKICMLWATASMKFDI